MKGLAMKAYITRVILILVIFNFSVPQANSFWFKVPKKGEAVTKHGHAEYGELDPSDIKILVWNMYKGKNQSWEEDFHFLSLNRDILILQEAYLDSKMGPVMDQDPDHLYTMATSFVYRKGKVRTGVATGSSIYPSKVQFEKSKKVEWFGLTPKSLLFTYYKIKGSTKKLLVINIHALNVIPWYVMMSHVKQAKEEIKAHDGPIIYAGDFNTWTKKKMKKMKKFMKKYGLKEVSYPNGGDRMRGGPWKMVLDHIFVRGLKTESSYVWGQLEGADHKALEATFSLQ